MSLFMLSRRCVSLRWGSGEESGRRGVQVFALNVKAERPARVLGPATSRPLARGEHRAGFLLLRGRVLEPVSLPLPRLLLPWLGPRKGSTAVLQSLSSHVGYLC